MMIQFESMLLLNLIRRKNSRGLSFYYYFILL